MSVFSDDRKCRRENLDRLIDEMYGEVEGKRDGLIIIGRCNKEALKKLNKKYKSVVSVNRNSTNYEVDEVLCDGKRLHQQQLNILYLLDIRISGMSVSATAKTATMDTWRL